MGVFVSNKYFKKLYQEQILPWKAAELIEANKQAKLILFLFASKSIDYRNKRILGIYYDVNKNLWVKKIFAYPDLIYRMGKSGKKQFKDKNIIPLNYQVGFNKYKVYEKLLKIESMRQYLPLSVIYKSSRDLKKMLELHNTVYLKGCEGGRGKQVIRLKQLGEERYEYSRFNNEMYLVKVDGFNKLISEIKGFFQNKEFLIQQAIDLLTIDNKIIDLRAEVQKNGNGELTVAGISVRVGHKNHPITTHANSYPFKAFFQNTLKYSEARFKELESRLQKLLFTAYKSIEKAYGPTAEIGIDVGLDKKGRLWFIECNSCSKKVSFYNTTERDAIVKSYLNILEYAKYLYNKSPVKNKRPKTLVYQPHQSYLLDSGMLGVFRK
ncbi:YheC/YheD family protein [Desulfofalx alkaliphila]|uniref:YheC/YheD family endospore coat-associated protein n=1 Tax=Desulfofalx alkaliphila TaxID=105483 RepID=UPI0012FF0063|nr:YheC/YheD family protein [Desulfofalx alkaliphila]